MSPLGKESLEQIQGGTARFEKGHHFLSVLAVKVIMYVYYRPDPWQSHLPQLAFVRSL